MQDNNDRYLKSKADLITDYQVELLENPHSPGSNIHGVLVTLTSDISACFPYLNTVLSDTYYDHVNCILIGVYNRRGYALRPQEIRFGGVHDRSEAAPIVDEVVGLVNRIWGERERITPSLRERKLPTIYDIYKLLPRTNCKVCGYVTCLTCAAEIRNGAVSVEKCPPLSKPEYMQNGERIRALFSSG